MTDCKNCKYTDEYCASGDCNKISSTSQSPRNGSQKGDLTAQWCKGELPSGWYYLKVNEELANYPVIAECVGDYNLGLPLSYFYDFDVAKIEQVLAPVPSYQWVIDHSFKHFSQRLFEKTLEDNKKLKELLKECKQQFEEVELYRYDIADTDQEDWFKISTEQASIANKMIAKIDEVLK